MIKQKSFQDVLRSDYENGKKLIGDRLNKAQQSFAKKKTSINDALPDFSPVQNYFKQQKEILSNELLADKTIKALFDFILHIITQIDEIIERTLPILRESYQKFVTILTQSFSTFSELIQKHLIPQIKELFGKLEVIISSLYTETVTIVSGFIERVVKSLKHFEDDFNKLAKVIGDLFKNVSKLFESTFNALKNEFIELYNYIIKEIKSSKGLEEYRKQIEEVNNKSIRTRNY